MTSLLTDLAALERAALEPELERRQADAERTKAANEVFAVAVLTAAGEPAPAVKPETLKLLGVAAFDAAAVRAALQVLGRTSQDLADAVGWLDRVRELAGPDYDCDVAVERQAEAMRRVHERDHELQAALQRAQDELRHHTDTAWSAVSEAEAHARRCRTTYVAERERLVSSLRGVGVKIEGGAA